MFRWSDCIWNMGDDDSEVLDPRVQKLQNMDLYRSDPFSRLGSRRRTRGLKGRRFFGAETKGGKAMGRKAGKEEQKLEDAKRDLLGGPGAVEVRSAVGMGEMVLPRWETEGGCRIKTDSRRLPWAPCLLLLLLLLPPSPSSPSHDAEQPPPSLSLLFLRPHRSPGRLALRSRSLGTARVFISLALWSDPDISA